MEARLRLPLPRDAAGPSCTISTLRPAPCQVGVPPVLHTDLTHRSYPTLQAGETTLEGEIARLTMRSMSSAGGLDFLGSLQQVS